MISFLQKKLNSLWHTPIIPSPLHKTISESPSHRTINKKVVNGLSFHTTKRTTSIIITNNSSVGKKSLGTQTILQQQPQQYLNFRSKYTLPEQSTKILKSWM
jgi:hypothetical protein